MDRMREQYGKGYKDGKEELQTKIDKAIKEISNLHGEYFAVMDKDYKTTHKRFLEPNEVLEILKRNIGE